MRDRRESKQKKRGQQSNILTLIAAAGKKKGGVGSLSEVVVAALRAGELGRSEHIFIHAPVHDVGDGVAAGDPADAVGRGAHLGRARREPLSAQAKRKGRASLHLHRTGKLADAHCEGAASRAHRIEGVASAVEERSDLSFGERLRREPFAAARRALKHRGDDGRDAETLAAARCRRCCWPRRLRRVACGRCRVLPGASFDHAARANAQRGGCLAAGALECGPPCRPPAKE